MPNLDDIAAFAKERGHNLTHTLRHTHVEALANAWVPEIRFHERERFHPVDLPGLLRIPPEVFANLPASDKEEFRIAVKTGTLNNGEPIIEYFDPPIVWIDSGSAAHVLGSGAKAADAMTDPALDRSAVFTYGARLEAGRQFFGASKTVSGATEPAPGDPRRPRHLPIVVHAELRVLLETLKHELELDNLPSWFEDKRQPIDAIWSGFAVEELFFFRQSSGPGPAFARPDMRNVLRALVAAHLAGDAAAWQAALNLIPLGWALSQRAWAAVTQYAFLEFYFVYAFNDYKEYARWPFENEHEGDVEGCCVVFERSKLEDLVAGTKTAAQVTAHTVITSVHEEFHDSDCLKRLPLANDKARDDLVVYVAPGSHATYLTPGSHDFLDFEDVVTDLPAQLPTSVVVLAIMAVGWEVLVALVVLAGILEHFVGSDDETSDNGVSVGPGEPDHANLKFEKKIEVTPLSNIEDDVNIYKPAFRATRAIRGYQGKWGGDNDLVSHSAPWENKTARYFRNFLKYGQINSGVIL
jgi:hypothetical protein